MSRLSGPAGFIRQGVAQVLLSESSRRAAPSKTAYVEGCLRAADRTGLTNAVRSISLHREDLAAELSRVVAPTLVVTSPDHKGFTPEQAEAAARLIPRGESAVVDGPAYLTPF